MIDATRAKAIEAYGGAILWQKARQIQAVVSTSGLAFPLKWRPVFQRAEILMDVHRPLSRLTPIGRDAQLTGGLDDNRTWLETPGGDMIAERQNARARFPFGRRLLWWDDLDMAYFANYAFWNYFTLPALLLNDRITWQDIAPGHLRAQFPADMPTHSPVQEFFFHPETGLLRQHNYCAQVIAPVAIAANVVTQHSRFEGVTFASQRRVTPRGPQGSALPGPLLIGITVHEVSLQ